ncbi:MAG: WD40/YVTN/BNR-like repeat-containing protein [Gemmatimonadota bacterium]
MRLLIATTDGIHTVRWIRGERSGHTEAVALRGEEVRSIAPVSSAIYAAARRSGIYRSTDRGESWHKMSSGVADHECVTLAISQWGADALYLGTEPAALFASHDGGRRWEERPGFRALGDLDSEKWYGYGARRPHVQTIACDPHDMVHLYAGVEIGGAYRSDDGGESWQPVNEGLYDDIHHVAVDPRDGSRLYAATGGGLHVSRDRGARWTRVPGEVGTAYGTAMLVPAATGRTDLYLATAAGPPATWSGRKGDAKARLHVSLDGGSTWREADPGPRLRGRSGYSALADDATREGAVFVATGDGSVYYVEDAGERWSKVLFGLSHVNAMTVV